MNASVVKRFWKYVDKTFSTNECWNWTGSLMKRGGYGQLRDGTKTLKAHRISYELHKGKIPKNLLICHDCGNPKCCNPKHLYAGTYADNWKDTIKHGTRYVPEAIKGEKNVQAKLTESQVIFIKNSEERGVDLAKKFNVTKQLICRIKKGKAWKHIKS